MDDCERASPPGCWLARLLSGVPHTTEGDSLGLDEARSEHGPSARLGWTVPSDRHGAGAVPSFGWTTQKSAMPEGCGDGVKRPASDGRPPALRNQLVDDTKDQTGFRMVSRVVTEQMKEVTETVAERIVLEMKCEVAKRV